MIIQLGAKTDELISFTEVNNMQLIRALLLLLMTNYNVSHAALFDDNEAREQIIVLRKQISEMETRIAKMEQAMNSQALLELYTQVETLGLELGRLNGQIEILNNDNGLLQNRQKDFYIDLDHRLRQIEQPDKRTPSSKINPKISPQSIAPFSSEEQVINPSAIVMPESISDEKIITTIRPSSGSLSANELLPSSLVEDMAYKEALNLFKNGDYISAISKFEKFLENYPQSNLAPGAAYWIGNGRYALRDYNAAIDAQTRLINIYPDSLKAPDAFLNIATSQHELGDIKASKDTLQDLVKKYPYSEAATKAKQRLASYK